MNSEWYKKRLICKQQKDIAYWENSIDYLKKVINEPNYKEAAERMNLNTELNNAINKLKEVKSDDYLDSLYGTIGADPLDVKC
jgi:hypothetical protein